jgi:hypothetical protein
VRRRRAPETSSIRTAFNPNSDTVPLLRSAGTEEGEGVLMVTIPRCI